MPPGNGRTGTVITWPLSFWSPIPGTSGNQHSQKGTMSYPPSKTVPILPGTRGVGAPAGDMYANKW